MGLFVVGRLADRHGIRVQLRPSGEQAGTTSLVMLPDAITHGGGGERAAARRTTSRSPGSSRSSRRPAAARPRHRRCAPPPNSASTTARYEDAPDDSRELDPVGRSLMREERRAAAGGPGADGAERPRGPDEAAAVRPRRTPQHAPRVRLRARRHDGAAGARRLPAAGTPGTTQAAAARLRPAVRGRRPAAGRRTATATPAADSRGYPSSSGYPDAAAMRSRAQATRRSDPQTASRLRRASPTRTTGRSRTRTGAATGPVRPSRKRNLPPAADGREPDRVGFDRPGPAPSTRHALTDAGLPRRGASRERQRSGSRRRRTSEPRSRSGQPAPATEPAADDWRSANDERWQRAEQLREPKAGGVTSSGLPRRVPKANLVEGTAETDPAGRPPGLPRPRGRPGQVEQPAPRRPAGTQRGSGHERTRARPGQHLQPGALV